MAAAITLSPDEALLVIDALDSHAYWQLAEADERSDGFVILHPRHAGHCPDRCKRREEHDAIRAAEALAERLRDEAKP